MAGCLSKSPTILARPLHRRARDVEAAALPEDFAVPPGADDPGDLAVVAHQSTYDLRANPASTVPLIDGDHRDIAVGDVVAQRPAKPDYVAGLVPLLASDMAGDYGAGGVGEELTEAVDTLDAMTPAEVDEE